MEGSEESKIYISHLFDLGDNNCELRYLVTQHKGSFGFKFFMFVVLVVLNQGSSLRI